MKHFELEVERNIANEHLSNTCINSSILLYLNQKN